MPRASASREQSWWWCSRLNLTPDPDRCPRLSRTCLARITSNESTGILLLNAVHEASADILVMGGYGHQPWREALFGGVTHEIVGTGLLPLLLMH